MLFWMNRPLRLGGCDMDWKEEPQTRLDELHGGSPTSKRRSPVNAFCSSSRPAHNKITNFSRASSHGYRQISRRTLPPYGRILRERLAEPRSWQRYWGTAADGSAVSLFVIVGHDAWEVAKYWRESRLFTVAPPAEDPNVMDWTLLAGHDPVLNARLHLRRSGSKCL